MWSNLVSQATDMANQVSQQIQTEVDNVQQKLKEDVEKSNETPDTKQVTDDMAAATQNSCPTAGGDQNNSEAEPPSEQVQNLTKQADQMADKIFTFASTWAGKALEATSETATKVQSVAKEVQNQATEKLQEIQDHELYKTGLAQTKDLTENVTKNVTNVTKTVVSTIEEKTIIGDFHKHQKDQIDRNLDLENQNNAAPWEGYEDWEILKQQILNLSTDKRTFVRNPPAGVSFSFDFQKSSKQAIITMKEDPNLSKMRFELVPKKLKEENFWRNYFYRVGLIKQSFNLKRLSSSKTSSKNSLNENSKASDSNRSVKSDKKDFEALDKADEVANENVHDNDMFISTELGNTEISADDLQAEMAALGMENDEDWEKELNQELAEYEIVDESGKDQTGEGNSGDNSQDTTDWEKEVNDMLT